MNSLYLEEYTSKLERILSVAHESHHSLTALQRMIAYSPYFNAIENDTCGFTPITTEQALIKEFFPYFKKDLLEVPTYVESLWAAESYLRIQEKTKLSFELIFLYIPITKMYEYFPIYHENDSSSIVKEFNRLYKEESVLSLLLNRYRYSLKELSKEIDVSYSVLSSLKQRRRDIRKSSVEIVIKLSRALHVRIETIAEIEL